MDRNHLTYEKKTTRSFIDIASVLWGRKFLLTQMIAILIVRYHCTAASPASTGFLSVTATPLELLGSTEGQHSSETQRAFVRL